MSLFRVELSIPSLPLGVLYHDVNASLLNPLGRNGSNLTAAATEFGSRAAAASAAPLDLRKSRRSILKLQNLSQTAHGRRILPAALPPDMRKISGLPGT